MDSGEVCVGSAAKQRSKASSTKRKAQQRAASEKKQNHVVVDGAASGDESDTSAAPAPTKGKGKGKGSRRRKKTDQFMEEDIIDGFAFISFTSKDDLEDYIRQTTAPKISPAASTPTATTPSCTPASTPPPPIHNPASPLRKDEPPATTCVTVPPPMTVITTPITKTLESSPAIKKRSPIEELERLGKKDGLLKNCKKTAAEILENNKLHNNLLSKSKSAISGRNTKVTNDRKSLLLVPPLTSNGSATNPLDWSFKDRASDTSTHSSVNSGQGYLCDSESEAESKASDVALEIFTTLSKGSNNRHSRENGIAHLNNKVSTASNCVVSTVTTTAPSTLPTTTTTVSSSQSTLVVLPRPLSSQILSSSSSCPHLFVREPPKPIPGLSGTRPWNGDSEKENTTPFPCTRSSVSSLHSHCVTPPSTSSSSSLTTTVTYSQSSSLPHNHCHRSSPISSASPSLLSSSSLSSSHHRHRSHNNRRTPTPTPPLHHGPRPPLPVSKPLHATPPHHPPSLPPRSMFAPPPPPSLTSTPLPGAVPPPPPFVTADTLSLTANPEILQQELNARFLQDRVLANSFCQSPVSYLRPPELHQHMHQHQHQHTHQHMCTYPPLAGGLAPPAPSPLLFDKFESPPFFRQNMPGFAGISPLLPPGPPTLPSAPLATVGSGLRGAFQPKSVPSSLHPSQLLSSWRDHEKVTTQPTPPSVTPVKKTGKWCAAHVRMAWEIHRHQQTQLAVNSSSAEPVHRKSAEMNHLMVGSANPLRPPSSLLPGVSTGLQRPGDRGSAGSLIGPSPHSRIPYDTPPPSHPSAAFLNPAHLGAASFSRTSPYSPLVGLGSGAFGGLGGMSNNMYGGRDLPAMPGLTSPQEWNRLHRTPPSFPTPPSSWPKPPGVDRDKERENEREKERNVSRSSPTAHRSSPRDSRERDLELAQKRDREMRDHQREKEMLKRGLPHHEHSRHASPHSEQHRSGSSTHSRSRSRSPITNGPSERLSSHCNNKPSGSGTLNDVMRHSIKVKEEHKDNVMHVDKVERANERRTTTPLKVGGSGGRDDIFPQTYLGMPYPSNSVSMLDRSQLHSMPYLGLERASLPPQHGGALWNPFDRRFDQQRLDLQREMEQREQMMRQLPLPVVAPATYVEDRLREQLYMRDQIIIREHLAQFDRERINEYFSQKVPRLRTEAMPTAPPGNLYLTQASQRQASLLATHNSCASKTNSPGSSVGVPPPLIPSSTVTTNHVTVPLNDVKPKAAGGAGLGKTTSGSTMVDGPTPDKHGERT